jgi:DNA-binding NtrC family response regulator
MGACHRYDERKRDEAVRVLAVGDFEVLARSMGIGLRREGMAGDMALDGAEALERLAVTRYDVVMLDRTCPPSTATTSADGSPPTVRTAGC